MKKKYRMDGSEVLYGNDPIIAIDINDIEYFQELSVGNDRNRVRLCAHPGEEDPLHEMLIVHERSCYVRPHKHLGKSESVHIIRGAVDIILFDDTGSIQGVVEMGEFGSGKFFYYRIDAPLFHTLVIRSNILVFHEVTNGPFVRSNTIFAPWSPDESNSSSVMSYLKKIEDQLDLFRGQKNE